ncbi:MAG: coproporphyrinogen III oxidase family protein [Actinobacteria bacterium]|nr:coproporphyrinogen III oxidase family protein [Actinomycetota bacterium]
MIVKHLYVHVPFCRSRCAYCDFASEPLGPRGEAGRVEQYVEALLAELEERGRVEDGGGGHVKSGGAKPTPTRTAPSAGPAVARTAPSAGPAAVRAAPVMFETIYLGGGTPTILPAELLAGLVRQLASRLDRSGGTPEFTIEANPGTIDRPLLEWLTAEGVSRFSLGIQSFAPALRAALGRRVAQEEIDEALTVIGASGRQEWNIDLVFGIPGQTWDEACADLDAAVAAGPSHISLYDLTYTTEFATRVETTLGAGARGAAGAFAEEHYAMAVARLESAGYHRYEVSNFALPGHECRHNQAYWRGDDYLGIGASAVSTLGAERRTNPCTVAGYLSGESPQIEWLSPVTRLWEKAMLGLRTVEGVVESVILPVLDLEARDRLLAQGCLERRCGKLRLNPGFLNVSNAVLGALLADSGE